MKSSSAVHLRSRILDNLAKNGWSSEWPANARPPPTAAAEALDVAGRWGLSACNVTIKECSKAKGRGAFATTLLPKNSVVGVYWGEQLTPLEYKRRHGVKQDDDIIDDGGSEGSTQYNRERNRRLAALPEGEAPIGRAQNHGSYSLLLVPSAVRETLEREDPSFCCYLDAEDSNLSSWCRYINHATDLVPVMGGDGGAYAGEGLGAGVHRSHRESPCNLDLKVDPRRSLAWLVARRDINAGEEIAFDYGPQYGAVEYTGG